MTAVTDHGLSPEDSSRLQGGAVAPPAGAESAIDYLGLSQEYLSLLHLSAMRSSVCIRMIQEIGARSRAGAGKC